MALSGSTVWEVRNVADWSGASDTNGGGFVAGASGTDYSYASLPGTGAAQYSLTNGQYVSGTTMQTASASADMIGNIAYIAGGTGSITAGWYQITGQSTGVSLTLDRSTGLVAGTGITITIGGCLATPGQAVALMTVALMKGCQRYSTTPYTLTTATPGSGGPLAFTFSSNFQGYQTTRGDQTGYQPVIAWPSSGLSVGSNTYIITCSTNNPVFLNNVILNGNNITNVSGCNGGSTYFNAYNCLFENFSGTNCYAFVNGAATRCEAINCAYGFYIALTDKCVATSCSVYGFYVTTNSCFKCIAALCNIGFEITGKGIVSQCTADSCTLRGFNDPNTSSTACILFDSCLASNQSGAGASGFFLTGQDILFNCAVYNNTTNVTSSANANQVGLITLTAQPYVVAGSDFRPNGTAGGGAALRAAGIGVYGQTDTVDIGAVQSTPSSGGIGRQPKVCTRGG